MQHTIAYSSYAGASRAMFTATCACGWHASSPSTSLRDWNREGHLQDVAPTHCSHCGSDEHLAEDCLNGSELCQGHCNV